LLFDRPQTIRTIRLLFKEYEAPRIQEFVLRWLRHGTRSWKKVVRQQWNFSSSQAIEECEEYHVDLASAAALESSTEPDIRQWGIRALLERLQLSYSPESMHYSRRESFANEPSFRSFFRARFRAKACFARRLSPGFK
jgi:hypothetical protein